MEDYRNTKYCDNLTEIQTRKADVEKMIKKDHPCAKNMHDYLKKDDEPYKNAFMKAYNGKCAYCGVSVDLIPKDNFEIDHFINEASFSEDKIKASSINNLVLACHACNHSKNAFAIDDTNKNELNPDGTLLIKNIIRDEKYYICVSDDAKEKHYVNDFYTILHLGAEIHRLDFLLMNMIGLYNKHKDSPKNMEDLLKAIKILKSKRNVMSHK